MALTELEIKRCDKTILSFLERRRPPPEIREKVDLAGRNDGHTVEMFEIRPAYDDPSTNCEAPVAKTTFVRRKNHWKIFRMKRDFKRHGYEPNLEVKSLEAFFAVVERDEFGCFFG
jgi:hypothetical protein